MDISRATRCLVAVASLAAAVLPFLATGAAGEETLSQLEARMESMRADLDATTQKVEDLKAREHSVEQRIEEIERRIAELKGDSKGLLKLAEERATMLYLDGSMGMVDALFGAEDLDEFATKTEMLSRVQSQDDEVFVKLSRQTAELRDLSQELTQREAELDQTSADLQDEVKRLREQLAEVGDEYQELKEQIAAARAEAARQAAAQEAATSAAPAPAAPAAPAEPSAPTLPAPRPVGDMVCPVNGPNSFIDSWGYPRSGGRSHEGTDIMADYGTPVVAIVSGTITLSSYGDSAGNWLILDGDDGNDYWYMHNQENLVNGGRVSVGQQIATVGDTGNATGVPHVHFEYHPGGGGPVNPYPVVRPLC